MENLSHKIWDEWTSFPIIPPVEDEIAGILDGSKCRKIGSEYEFTSGRIFAVRRLLKLWSDSEYQNIETIKIIYGEQPKNRLRFLLDAELVEKIFQRISRSSRKKRNWNWVRGIWGSCGALYVPKAGYHLVLRPPSRNGSAERLQSILKSAGFSVGVRKKNQMREIMLRDQQQIVTFLLRLGFVKSVLALEETAIYRAMRSRANKLVNCDSANINKTLEAAERQMKLINEIEEAGILEELPDELRELIFARKKNPSISLKELGQNLSRPISKSTVEYRWKKCENILHKLLKGDGAHVFGKSRR
ncbi:MAG: DNA-binding protein WhiA [Synergistaceae bacterium]|nr:DNA-binding protein WhiA [Synergistaceae bacterium]